jgi:hypothetical protein
MSMRIHRIALACAVLIFAGGHADAADWQTYVFRDAGFSVESPVALTKGEGAYRGAIAGRMKTVTYSGEAENIAYKVSIIDISQRMAEAVNLFEEMEFLTTLAGKVVANESEGIEPGKDRHYGRQLVVDTKDGRRVMTGLLFNGGKIYASEAAVLPGGDKDSIFLERFIGSILFDLDGPVRTRDADPSQFTGPDGK